MGRGRRGLRVANLHLDGGRRRDRDSCLTQLLDWLGPRDDGGFARPTVVLGDFNGTLAEPGFAAFADAGLRSALPEAAGPTSNGFGRVEHQHQIDHVFLSRHLGVVAAEIRTDAGLASDHYPVVVELEPAP
ncbi:MAG: endonuclease/exonuclease/phosphatase family protein [Acidimicrobiales bacterium]